MSRLLVLGGRRRPLARNEEVIQSREEADRRARGAPERRLPAVEVRPGTVIYEIAGVPADVAKRAFERVAHKLPIKVRYLARRSQ